MCSRREVITRGLCAGFTAIAPFGLHAQQQGETSEFAAQLAAIDILWGDYSDEETRLVEALAARVSVNSQTLVLYNPTEAVWEATLDGARRATLAGQTVVNGMLLASDDRPYIEIYANGQLTGTIFYPDPELVSANIQDALARDYRRHIEPLGLGSQNSDG